MDSNTFFPRNILVTDVSPRLNQFPNLKIALPPPESSRRTRSNHQHDPVRQKARVKEQRKALQTCFLSTINPVLPPCVETDSRPPFDPRTVRPFQSEIAYRNPVLLFNGDLCLPIGQGGMKDERQPEIRGNFSLLWSDICRGHHPQRGRERREEEEEERSKADSYL